MDPTGRSQYPRRCHFSSHVQTGVPRTVGTRSDLLENLWNSLTSAASAGRFVYCAGRDTSQGNFPALCRQGTRATLYRGALWGNRSCSALSFRGCILQEGKQLPTQKHPSDQNSLLAGPALRSPPPTQLPQESPRQDLSCLEAGSLYRTSSTGNISLSKHPPPHTAGVFFRLVPRMWRKT